MKTELRQAAPIARFERDRHVRRRLLAAARDAFSTADYDDVDLDAVAAAAGAEPAELARLFGDRSTLFLAMVAEDFNPGVEDTRYANPPGDLDEAIAALMEDYERNAEAVLRYLDLEARCPEVKPALDRGRTGHRQWVAYS